jgi:Fe-S-cluster-containing hydrogenase component 2
MLNIICKSNCKVCFAEPVCAVDAIIDQQGSIYVETDKCIGCGCCRTACVAFSYDHALKEKTVEWLKGAA